MIKKIEEKINNLTGMVKKGFDSVDERFDKMDKRLLNLKRNQEDIKSKLDGVAYRF